MKAPLNRKVFVAGYDAITCLGNNFETTWRRAVNGESGFTRVTRCQTRTIWIARALPIGMLIMSL